MVTVLKEKGIFAGVNLFSKQDTMDITDMFKIPLFKNFTLKMREEFLDKLEYTVEEHPKGKTIIHQGTTCNALHVLLKGKLNVDVLDVSGNIVRGREYNGLVYSVTDDSGNKVGNPFKSSLFGKSVGYDAVQRKFARSKTEIKDRKLADMTKRTVLSVLQGTYDKERFIATLKEKGIDTVLRYTEEGRIYGTTFIDHRTGCVLNGSRMGRELSANALQEHFTLPYAGQPPVPLFITTEGQEETQAPSTPEYGRDLDGMGLFSPEGPAVDAEEEAFIRAMQRRKKKKKRKGLGM